MARRDTDRWVTPRVVVWGLLAATIVVLAAIGSVTYLTAIGKDPSPMLDVVSQVGTAVAALGALAVQLANRATVTKVERNVNQQTKATEDLAAVVADQAPLAYGYPETIPVRRHRTAPAPGE
jgi:hypothetical protein